MSFCPISVSLVSKMQDHLGGAGVDRELTHISEQLQQFVMQAMWPSHG